MKHTLPEHTRLLQEIGLLAYRAELMLERVQRKTANATLAKPFTRPMTHEEMDTIGAELKALSTQWQDLTARVLADEKAEPKTEAQPA